MVYATSIRIKEDFLKEIDIVAKREHRTRTAFLINAAEIYIENSKKKEKKE
jgi:predicted transcriptional regulator